MARKPAVEKVEKAVDDPLLAKQRYSIEPIGNLLEHPKNPRRGDPKAIGESILANKFYGAIVAQESSRRVIVGNHRLVAGRNEGMKHLPVIFIDVDDATAERIMLVDNRSSDGSTYDKQALASLLQYLHVETPEGLVGSGYEETDLVSLQEKLAPPSAFPEFDESVTVTKCCPKCGFQWS